ncbi:bacteriorhodopsin subfamily protein, partial [Acanthamoeba castellanii str. Neff]
MQNRTFPSSGFSSGTQTNNSKKLNQRHHHPAAHKPQPAASLFGGGYATNPQYMWRSAAGSHQLAPNSKRRSMDAKEAFGLDGSLPSQPVVPPLGGAINNNINISINNTNNVGPGTGRRSSLPGVMPSSTGGLGAYPLPISPLSAGGGAGATATSAAAKKKKSGISGKLQHTPEQKEAGKGRWIVVMSRCIVLFFFTFCLGLSMAEERFGVLSRLGCVFAPESNAASLRQMDKYILAVVVSFGMSFVIDFLGALYSVSREKRLLYTLSSSVHLLGGTTKVLLYLRALPVLVDFAGRPLYMVHYLQWSCTTPMLILLIGRLSLASRKKLLLVMVLDVLTMVTGFFSSFCFNVVFVLFWGTLSFVFFFMVLYGVHHFIQLAIAHYPSKERSFNGLFAVTATCWSVFPIIWLLGAFDLVNPDIELYAYLTIDVSVKVVFSVFLRQITLSSIEHREVQEYEKFKEAKEQAESLAELHRQFLSNMSHEIRTPLKYVFFSAFLLSSAFPSGQLRLQPGCIKAYPHWLYVRSSVIGFS